MPVIGFGFDRVRFDDQRNFVCLHWSRDATSGFECRSGWADRNDMAVSNSTINNQFAFSGLIEPIEQSFDSIGA